MRKRDTNSDMTGTRGRYGGDKEKFGRERREKEREKEKGEGERRLGGGYYFFVGCVLYFFVREIVSRDKVAEGE